MNKVKVLFVDIVGFEPRESAIPIAAEHLAGCLPPNQAARTSFERLICSDADDTLGVISRIAAFDPDLLCFSCYAWNVHSVQRLCKLVKQAIPDMVTAAGGPHFADQMTMKAFQAASGADILVRGNGEGVFRDIVADLLDGKPVTGESAFQQASSSEFGPRDIYARPSFRSLYDTYDFGVLLYECCRGCPLRCPYCAWGEGTPAYKNLELVERELDSIYGSFGNVNVIHLTDSTISLKPDYYRAFLERAAHFRRKHRSGKKMFLHCAPGTIDTSLLNLFRRAGVDRVGFGVQSREPKVLAGLQRKDRFQIFLERSHLHNSGVVFDAQFIYGLPFETITSLRRGIDRTYTELSAHSIRNVEPRFFRLSVLPGTEFDGRRADLGYVVDDFHFSEITQSKWMSCRDVEEARLLAVFCMSVLNRRIRSERGGCLAGGSAVELWNAFRGWLNEKHSVNDLHDLEQSELDLLREFENFEVSHVR